MGQIFSSAHPGTTTASSISDGRARGGTRDSRRPGPIRLPLRERSTHPSRRRRQARHLKKQSSWWYRPGMLVLTAFIEVAPADRDAIRAALPAVITATRAEDGCEEYGCYEDTLQAGR